MERKVDYIIVGFGIAGACFAQQALMHNKSFVVIDGSKPSATRIAAGTLNPVVLKRIHAVWKVQEFFSYARDFYKQLQTQLKDPFLKEIPIYRYFHDTEEHNDWLVASDRTDLSDFLDPQVHYFPNKPWSSPLGFGKVKQSMRLDTVQLLDSFKSELIQKDSLRHEEFLYKALHILKNGVVYKDLHASKIVFAEGVNAMENPFFPQHLLIPKKGEYITVSHPNHQLDAILKGKYFYVPLNDAMIKVGATFAHGDNTDETTEKGKLALLEAVKERFSGSVTLVNQVTGKRPTVKDRRPLVGSLKDNDPLYFLNGLGTRGILLAPYLSKQLFDHMEDGIPLEREINIRRFLT